MLVYKYRGINNDPCDNNSNKIFERDLRTLEKNQFWASDIVSLNDPCEAITDTVKIKNFLNYIGKKVGMKSQEDFKMVEENTDKVLSLDQKMGIYSLSKTPLDELLWTHYSNSHKGFCLEYDLDILLQGDGPNHLHSYSVIYSKKPPTITSFDIVLNRREKMMRKFGFYKSKRWAYEKEHRIISSKRGLNSYNYKALKSVYFGLKMDDLKKKQIMDCLRGRGIQYYQIAIELNSYKFVVEEVQDKHPPKITYLKELYTSPDEAVNFEIIKSKIYNFAGIGEIDVLLKTKPTKNQLFQVSNHLKDNILSEGKTIFINYYLTPPDHHTLPCASANFKDGEFKIEITGKN